MKQYNYFTSPNDPLQLYFGEVARISNLTLVQIFKYQVPAYFLSKT